jgi:hypothetical protein
MSRVFNSKATGAAVYVFSDDHCPPHVHARHRSEGWIARVCFSCLDRATELMSLEPVKNFPMRRVVNNLLDEIQDRLSECRSRWWMTRRTTCLANQWAIVRTPGNVVISDHVPGAKQIRDAEYDPTNKQLRLIFRDGTSEEVRLRS